MSPVQFRNPATVAAPLGAYAHVAEIQAGTGLLFLSGQVGIDPSGQMAKGAAGQYREALRNVMRLLAAEGLAAPDIVKINTYLVEPIAVEEVRAIRTETLGTATPAATLVYVPRLALPGLLAEVEAIAARRAP